MNNSGNRHLFRFGQHGDASSSSSTVAAQLQQPQGHNLFSNSANSLNSQRNNAVKRSISQVPAATPETIRRNQLFPANGTNGTYGDEFQNSFDANSKPIIDYQAAYELIKKENDQLKLSITNMQKEMDDNNKVFFLES
jgi:hypothetical protein